MSATPAKILPLESLRGLAALCVATYHFRTHSPLTENTFIAHAYLMVDFFFVLSGFVMAHNYAGRLANAGALIAFQRKRFWRLYPLHLVTFVVFIGIEIARLLYARSGETGVAPYPQNNAVAALNNLLLTQALFEKQLTFNYPSWSISVEFYTYLVFGAIVVWLQRRATLGFAVCAFAALCALGTFESVFTLTTGAALLRCIYGFMLGAIVQRAVDCRLLSSRQSAAVMAVLAAVLAEIYLPHTPFELAIPPVFALCVGMLASLSHDTKLSQLLGSRGLVYLGTISYSLYMCHAALWWALNQTLRFGLHIGTATDPEGITRVAITPLQGTALTLGGLTLLIGISHCTYVWIENPFRHGLPFRHPSQGVKR